MINNLKFSVVVVTYNRIELLKECIENIQNQEKKFDEIIIVDNCSTDGTNKYLQKIALQEKKIKIISLDENLGGAGGFYNGLSCVSGNMDYVLIIDDDAILHKNFLKELSKGMEEGILAYSGSVLTNGKIDTSHRRRLKNRLLLLKEDVEVQEYFGTHFYYDLATFCGLVVSRKLIQKIGLPEKDYFIWYDDTEYSLRILKYTKIKNINGAIINHKTKNLENVRLSWKSYYGYRNAIDMGKRHASIPIIYIWYRYLYHIFRIVYFAVKQLYDKCEKEYCKNCFQLHKQVLRDAICGNLGKSEVYYPGKKI